MKRNLKIIIWILAFSSAFNIFITTLTIVGLDDDSDKKVEYDQTVFESVTLSMILGASSIVSFLDLSLLGRLKIRELRHLDKREFRLMKYKPINGGAALKGIC